MLVGLALISAVESGVELFAVGEQFRRPEPVPAPHILRHIFPFDNQTVVGKMLQIFGRPKVHTGILTLPVRGLGAGQIVGIAIYHDHRVTDGFQSGGGIANVSFVHAYASCAL